MRNNIIQPFLDKGYLILEELKSHLGKRYTYKISKDNTCFVGKIHTNEYLISQRNIHYGLDILSSPEPRLIVGMNMKNISCVDRFVEGIYTFSIYEYIEGESLEELIKSGKPMNTNLIFDSLISTFIQFSSTQIKDRNFGPIQENGKGYKSWKVFIEEYFIHKISICKERQILDSSTIELLCNILYSTTFPEVKNIVHYDLSTSNIIHGLEEELSFIDWDGYYIGDFNYSIAKFLYYLHSNDFMPWYDTLLRRSEQITSSNILKKYLLLVVVEKLSVMFNKNYQIRFIRDLNLLNQIIKNDFI